MTQESSERLARALTEAEDPRLLLIIKRAREDYYHDYLSPLATPCIQLVSDLRMAGREDLALRARQGEWDASKEESDAWARSDEGQAMMREMFGEGSDG